MSNVTVQTLGSAFVDKVSQAPNTDAAQLASDFEAFSAGLEGGSKGAFAEFVSAQLGKSADTAWMVALIAQTAKSNEAPALDAAMLEVGQLNNDIHDDRKNRGNYILFLREGKMVPQAELKASIQGNEALEMRVMNWEKHNKAVNFGIAIGVLESNVLAGVAVKSFRTSHTLPVQGQDAFLKSWDTIKAQVS